MLVRICLLLVSLQVLVLGTSAPSSAPSTTPTSSSPTRSPTPPTTLAPSFSPTVPKQQSKYCPTQTNGIDSLGTIITGSALSDNFTGTVYNPFVAGRSAVAVLAYQSDDAISRITVQFAASFANTGNITSSNPPNITWQQPFYQITDWPNYLKLQGLVFTAKTLGVFYESSSDPKTNASSLIATLKYKTINPTTKVVSKEVDTGFAKPSYASTLKIFAGYYLIGFSATGVSGLRQFQTVSGSGSVTNFVAVTADSTILTPALGSSTSNSNAALDAKGIIVLAYRSAFANLAIAVLDTNGFTNQITYRNSINFTSVDISNVQMVSPGAGRFLIVLLDNTNNLRTVYSTNAFTSYQSPILIGPTAFASPRISLIWNSFDVIAVFEAYSTKLSVFARSFDWTANITKNYNSTGGKWEDQPSLLTTTTSAWSNLRISGQTSYGWNILADVSPAKTQIVHDYCGVFTLVAPKKSGIISSASWMAGVIITLALTLSF